MLKSGTKTLNLKPKTLNSKQVRVSGGTAPALAPSRILGRRGIREDSSDRPAVPEGARVSRGLGPRVLRGRLQLLKVPPNPQPPTLHPKLYILHRTAYTLSPQPYTVHPTPCTPHPTPEPSTLKLQPQSPNPQMPNPQTQPSTLIPGPRNPTLNLNPESRFKQCAGPRDVKERHGVWKSTPNL